MSTDLEVDPDERITLSRERDQGVVRHEGTGIARHGDSGAAALAQLGEAMALHRSEFVAPVTDEDFDEWCIDLAAVPEDSEVPEAPWFEEGSVICCGQLLTDF